jgi:hypothetical protein
MATIKLKRSATPGNVPTLSDGEFAINTADEILYYRNAAGTVKGMSLPSAGLDGLASTALQINGAMEIDQIHQGASVVLTNGAIQYAIDQWQVAYHHTANTAVFSTQQVSTGGAAPLGTNLTYGLRLLASTALTSPSSGDFVFYRHPVEGWRWERLCWGLSMARSISIGFWVYSDVAATGSLAIRNAANNRSYVTNFTVAASATKQWVTMTIPGDQAGVWVGGNVLAAEIDIVFACGSQYQAPTANTWLAGNYIATSANTNFYPTNGNSVVITGFTMLVGNNMPLAANMGLLMRPTSEEISLCQRYYWTTLGTVYTCAVIGNSFTTSGYIGGSFIFPVEMRASPTVSVVGAWNLVNVQAPVAWLSSQNGFSLYALAIGAVNAYYYQNGPTTGIVADARM